MNSEQIKRILESADFPGSYYNNYDGNPKLVLTEGLKAIPEKDRPIVIIAHDENLALSLLVDIEAHCEKHGYNEKLFIAGLTVMESDLDLLSATIPHPRDEIISNLIKLCAKAEPISHKTDFEEISKLANLKTKEAEQLESILRMDDKPVTRGDHKSRKQNYRNFSRKHNF